ncbi:hypothetical protein GBF38_010420 [Nibea albiflora]|uniref:Uncharacterized protein n=1 Tax=Nibea albiflora TaxID=240163 RepID=A0ACB7F426_NIBAL|nr:hypothetical protein GBF38_010420 [Nibea albiflora]
MGLELEACLLGLGFFGTLSGYSEESNTDNKLSEEKSRAGNTDCEYQINRARHQTPDNMSSESNIAVVQEFPLATIEIIRPLVRLFLSQITVAQWSGIYYGAVDEQTEMLVTQMCVDMVNAISRIFFESLKKLRTTKGMAPVEATESPEYVSEHEVHQYLGTAITDAFEDVTGSPMLSKSSKKVTDLVTREVAERINSQLTSTGSDEFEPQRPTNSAATRRVKVIVKYMTKMLKKCAWKITSSASTTPTAAEISEDMPEASQSLAEEELFWETGQTPVSSGQADRYSVGSFVDIVKHILEEEASDSVVICHEISDAEHAQIESSMLQDTKVAASDIASYLWINREILGLNSYTFSKSSPEAGSEKSSPEAGSLSELDCWKVVANKIKRFFACRFAKEAMINSLANLREKLCCFSKKASMDVLIPAATEVLQDIFPPPTPHECSYETMAICIKDDQNGSKKMEDVLFDHFKPGSSEGRRTIQVEVDRFMKLVWNWLLLQAKQHARRNHPVKKTLEKIQGVVNGELEVTVLEGDAVDPASPSATTPIATTPIATTPIATTPIATTPIATTPIFESTPPCVSSAETKDLFYLTLVSAVINEISKKGKRNISVAADTFPTIVGNLKNTLCSEMAGFDLALKLDGARIKKIAKAVHKDLCKVMGSKGTVQMSLQSQDSVMYRYITESLKRHLVTPKTSGVKGLFNSLKAYFTRG